MPLIDLRTDLKSLKYGQDQPGGGNSGQPYIQVDINRADTGFNRFRLTKFDDKLVRGGFVGAANASVVDTIRIGKFLTDFPQGPLFIAKQIGLQLSNPQLEHKTTYSTSRPTTGVGIFTSVSNFVANTANKILNAVGPTRIYNLGINTLAQVPVNAFGQHIVRHGLTPRRNDDNLYINVAQFNNNTANNRLTKLQSKFGLGDGVPNPTQDRQTLGLVNRAISAIARVPVSKVSVNPEQLTISSYISGPQSVYGIGKTVIQRYTFTEDATKINPAKNRNYNRQHIPEIKINRTWDYGVSQYTSSIYSADRFNLIRDNLQQLSSSFTTLVASKNDPTNSRYVAAQQEASASQRIKTFTAASNYSSSVLSTNRFPGLINNTPPTLLNYTASNADISASIKAWNGALTASNDLGLSKVANITSSINTNQNVIPYTGAAKTYNELRAQINKTSTINQNFFTTAPITVNRGASNFQYLSNNGTSSLKDIFTRTNDTVVFNDTMALQFTPLDPFTGNALNILKFLGYLSDYSEDYNSTWNPVRYTGRAESFYVFNEFKRTVSISFQIPCYNREELIAKHCLLSELASTLAGKYKNNLLGGIITRLKLGNYINNQPGIITNLNFTPLQESNWDLDIQLAYYLKVSFGFTVIHDYLPQYYDCGFIFKEPTPEPEPTPVPPPVTTPPVTSSAAPPPVVPQVVTGSYRDPIGRTNVGEKIDNTRVKKPIMLIIPPKKSLLEYGGGSYGGGGGGMSGRLW